MSYGRPDIVECLDYLKHHTGGLLNGSVKQNRMDCKNLIAAMWGQFQPTNPVVCVKRLIDVAMKDGFHARNANSMGYLLRNKATLVKLGLEQRAAEARTREMKQAKAVDQAMVGKVRKLG